MMRPVDAPDQVFSTVEQAAAWLGLDVREFRREAAAHPEILRASTRHKRHRYHWKDLVCFEHLSSAGRLPPLPPEKKRGRGESH
jgi:hypothetical protein